MRYRIGGLIHGGAYFRNFTVYCTWVCIVLCEFGNENIINNYLMFV